MTHSDIKQLKKN